jgi:beta-galactosidase
MLAVCYHPEHWPEERWSEDARMMADLGLRFVRIGEFAWSRIEPERNRFEWGWLDRALERLAVVGLQIVLCTPTATPPKWLIDQRPDILAWDADGRPRGFGSRRHYCFSSPAWREETARICAIVAERYGRHPGVVGWQLDNEYGCHDTVLSYAPHCRVAFRRWLKRRYGAVARLNEAWGNVFWSQEYNDFDQIDLPHRMVAGANPAHCLDFRRFASDQVIAYNRMQAEIVRQHSPQRFVAHNCIARFHDFDHRALAEDLDVLGWDSYPLGSAARLGLDEAARLRFARTGHPDLAAWHHDRFRGLARERRFWVMEQQPGPVNWAAYNPEPAAGMVRLWAIEARAHGAEVVSFFPWRQAPFAQEQMHAGLLRRDGAPDAGFAEARRAREDLRKLDLEAQPVARAPVALLTDDPSHWVLAIQPHGAGFDLARLNLAFYGALRQLGQDVDVLWPGADLAGYRLIVVPSLPIVTAPALASLRRADCTILLGPRTGSKTEQFQIPPELPPGPLQALLPLKVAGVASLPPGLEDEVRWQDRTYPVGIWRERLETDLEPMACFAGGGAAVVGHERCRYLGFWPDEAFLLDYLAAELTAAGLSPQRLPADLRLRRRGALTFAFNYGSAPVAAPAPADARFVLGGAEIGAHDLAVWRV